MRTSPGAAGRDAERFDLAVQTLLDGAYADDADLAALAGQWDDELGRDLAGVAPVAARLAHVGTLEVLPRPDFVSELRVQLVAQAERQATAGMQLALPARSRRRQRGVAALIAGAVLAGTGATAAVAAQDALPGQSLYGVKRGLEQAELWGSGDADRGAALLDHARTRLDEAAALEQGSPADQARAAQAVTDFTAQARQGGSSLLAAYAAGDAPDGPRQVRDFARESLPALTALSGSEATGPETLAALVAAAADLVALDREAGRACAACGDGSLQLPDYAQSMDAVERASARLDDAVLGGAGVGSGAGAAQVDNSHPVQVDPRVLRQARAWAEQMRERSTSSTGSAGTAAGSASAPAPTSTSEAPALTQPLEGAVKQIESGLSGTGESVKKTTGSVTGTVKDTVKDTVDGVVEGGTTTVKKGVTTLLPGGDPSPLP